MLQTRRKLDQKRRRGRERRPMALPSEKLERGEGKKKEEIVRQGDPEDRRGKMSWVVAKKSTAR